MLRGIRSRYVPVAPGDDADGGTALLDHRDLGVVNVMVLGVGGLVPGWEVEPELGA
eukprot:JZ551901.1.p2 GENE.JZ551901.1~~JZ551901.1.p2  ORF type:complete len:56 (-),score=10.42 JZ551901.1:18-185(-)